MKVGSLYTILQAEQHAPPTTTTKELATKVEILGIRPATASSTGTAQYFIHYVNTDKRLDKWIGAEYIGVLVEEPLPIGTSSRRGSALRQPSASSHGTDGHGHLPRSPIRSVHAHGHHDPKTKVRNVSTVQFGKYNIDTWYYSPYPDPFGAMVETLYICEFTFKYMRKKKTLQKHLSSLKLRRPPGRQIYDDPNRKIAVFEMVGRDHRVYCQNLCLFAKLFIEHKTLYYDADPFLFYVLTEYEEDGTHHPVGYYSKEIHSSEEYNLACILTYPPFQRNGYGRFLMSLSYEISKREHKLGSPEKPLSDLGKLSYRSYWQYVLLTYLYDNPNAKKGQLTLDLLCNKTAIKPEDAISTLQHMHMVRQWKGQLVLYFTRADIEERLGKYTTRNYGAKVCIDKYLTWSLPEGGYDGDSDQGGQNGDGGGGVSSVVSSVVGEGGGGGGSSSSNSSSDSNSSSSSSSSSMHSSMQNSMHSSSSSSSSSSDSTAPPQKKMRVG
jgi:histone acetyltransferase MYST1